MMKVYRSSVGFALEIGLIPVGTTVVYQPDQQQLELSWRQRGLSLHRVCIVDPLEKPTTSLKPRQSLTLLFTDKVSKPWQEWLATHELTIETKPELTPALLKSMLKLNKLDFKLTHDAADFVVSTLDKSSYDFVFSIIFTLDMARDKNTLNLQDVLEIWPDPNAKLAREISRTLGSTTSLSLARGVPRYSPESIFGLWTYLEIVCKSTKPELLNLLHMYRNACDRKKFSYWEGLQLFVHACYREEHWQLVSTQVGTYSLPQKLTLQQENYQICSINL
jgi:hypothetical protein